MCRFKAAIFDADGTIIDSMYVWEKVDRDFLTEHGIAVTQEYSDAVRGMFFRTAAEYTKAKYGLDESVEDIMQAWLGMARREYEFNVRSKPFVKEYLEYLKQKNIRIGLATSSDPYLLEPVLKNNGLHEYFDTVCYTSEVGKNKSFPDVYIRTAEKLCVAPESCIVFEDIPEGIEVADKAGMYTVAVYDRASEKDLDHLKRKADKYIFDFSEMLGEKFNGQE